jgi:hypothetical protein
MRESTRIYSRMISSVLLAGVSIASYVRLGEIFWLVIGLFSVGFAVFCLVRARTVGDVPAPPLTNPHLVKRLSMVFGTAGVILLITMLWRVQGQWNRLIEQENLWLAMGWIILLGIAAFAPIELRSVRPRSSASDSARQ